MKIYISLVLCLALILSLVGCGSSPAPGSTGGSKPVSGGSTDLSADISAKPVNTDAVELNGAGAAAATDFAVRLFQAGINPGENTLLSPVSVLYALAMTANGAKGETQKQMEAVLGLSVPELNGYLHAYWNSLPESEKYRLQIANAIWFTDDPRFTADRDFLQANADYYGAGIFQAPMDESTRDDINSWVEKQTDGMIKDILDEIPDEAVMYLVNALSFDAEWQDIYYDYQVRDGSFTKENGEKQDAQLMYSDEALFLEDENATGFIKYYADAKYAFAALLPDEGVTVEEYVSSLTGEKLRSLLSAPQSVPVSAAIPKFESKTDTEMSEVLINMGMPDAFDGHTADFSGLGVSTGGNICINRVLHKTYIAVDAKGTKAGAATVVEMTDGGASIYEDTREVILNRPFLYMLIDCEANLPLFFGAMMELE